MTANQKNIKAVKQDLQNLAEHTHMLLGSTANVTTKRLKEARFRIDYNLDNVVETISDHAKVIDTYLQANPYALIKISLSVGFLLGLVISRKR